MAYISKERLPGALLLTDADDRNAGLSHLDLASARALYPRLALDVRRGAAAVVADEVLDLLLLLLRELHAFKGASARYSA
jgi:hypothetical protein